MARVISEDISSELRVTHRSCGAIVGYFPIELLEDYTTDYLGCKDYYKYLNCPKCCGRIKV